MASTLPFYGSTFATDGSDPYFWRSDLSTYKQCLLVEARREETEGLEPYSATVTARLRKTTSSCPHPHPNQIKLPPFETEPTRSVPKRRTLFCNDVTPMLVPHVRSVFGDDVSSTRRNVRPHRDGHRTIPLHVHAPAPRTHGGRTHGNRPGGAPLAFCTRKHRAAVFFSPISPHLTSLSPI